MSYLKNAWTISWNATANGIVSVMPMVNGDGPRDEPNPILAVRNSKLPTLSARDIFDGLTRPRTVASERRDGGRGIAILLAEVGVGIWRLFPLTDVADGGADTLISPISEKISPKSVYLFKETRCKISIQKDDFVFRVDGEPRCV